MEMAKRILILCTGNSARSQMAEGILRDYAGEKIEVFSAGINPSSIRPEAIQVLKEIGIDISHQRAKSITEFAGQQFDYLITVCNNAREECPVLPGNARQIHHNFEDPPPISTGSEAERLAVFRRVRDEIRVWVRDLII